MKFYNFLYLIVCSGLLLTSACKKDDTDTEIPTDNSSFRAAILYDLGANVILASYADMATSASQLRTETQNFALSPSPQGLNDMRTTWRAIRGTWEQTEGFLFGPVASNNIDPRIDTWPVNHHDLDSILLNQSTFDESYVDGLEDALKGFHPIEYLLFGLDGNKTVDAFSDREKAFLVALATNLETLCNSVRSDWSGLSGSFRSEFHNAGPESNAYTSQKAAFEEVVMAMAGICDEVAGGKIGEPFLLADPSLEESPYAKNSLSDFRNNIRSVENVYLGRFVSNGKGIEDWVRVYNLTLDATIKTRIAEAYAALDGITVPFGQAITEQPTQVQNAIDRIEALKAVLEDELLPLIQQRIPS